LIINAQKLFKYKIEILKSDYNNDTNKNGEIVLFRHC